MMKRFAPPGSTSSLPLRRNVFLSPPQVQDNDKRLSRWTLSTHQFGRDWEFSWLARNLPPIKNNKIHWVSEPGSASLPGAAGNSRVGQGWCVQNGARMGMVAPCSRGTGGHTRWPPRRGAGFVFAGPLQCERGLLLGGRQGTSSRCRYGTWRALLCQQAFLSHTAP